MRVNNIRTVGALIEALQQLPAEAGFMVICIDGTDTVSVATEKDYDGVERVWIAG